MTDRRGFALPAPSVDMAQTSETISFYIRESSFKRTAFLLYFLVLALFYIPAHDRTNIYIHNCLPPYSFYQHRQAATLIILLL